MASKNATFPKTDKLTINFEHEKETKNMVRFSEVVENWDNHIIGKLYMNKAAWTSLAEPGHITVTINKTK